MMVTEQQIRKLLMEHTKNGQIGMAAMKAGMNRKTAAKYVNNGQPSMNEEVTRGWRTRGDPFQGYWDEAETLLKATPELEGRALFDWLNEKYPDVFHAGQLRTFQRRVKQWRAQRGPEKEVYFSQDHRPGVRMSTDFTCMNKLAITIRREPFDHLVCHSVLSYSNWEWVTICQSESFLALRKGVQAALLRLGHLPVEHWTDHTTAATHELGAKESARRGFNKSYREMMAHFGVTPRTIGPSKPNENGDVESENGIFKRRVEQHLLLRGSRDFENHEAYRALLEEVAHKANRLKQKRLKEELAVMRPMKVALMPEFVEEEAWVSRGSTIQSSKKVYSVPSRLIGETVRVRRYDEIVEVYYGGQLQAVMPRVPESKKHFINYRHIIEWLVRKPGAFAQYRFREDLFPSVTFRRAYDQLCKSCSPRIADQEYLRILRQAARTMESEVERVLTELEQRGLVPRWHFVQEFWPTASESVPELQPLTVTLREYDALLQAGEVTP